MMERWKQRNSLNLDTKFGKNYLGKLFGAGSNNPNSKSSFINGEGAFNNNNKNRHYTGLQPLSPCWELSDSFSHSRATSSSPKNNSNQIATWRSENCQPSTPRRPYSICGPITTSHYANYSVPPPSQTNAKEFHITPLVELRKKKSFLHNRWKSN